MGEPVHYAALFRRLGVFTVGIGHFFTLDRSRFIDRFDRVLGGDPSPSLVDIVRSADVAT